MIRAATARLPAILIGGCGYGAGNIGDEGILSGLLCMIRQVAPRSRVGVLADNAGEVQRIHNVEAWDHWSACKVMSVMRRFDVFLCGGATLADDTLNKRYPIRHCTRMIAMARLLGLRVMMTTIGANRFSTREGAFLVRYFYGSADRITVRDKPSKEVLTGIGIKRHIEVAADPAFVAEPSDPQAGNRILAEAGLVPGQKPVVGVSVVNERYGSQGQYKRALAAACDALIEHRNAVPLFVAHECRPEYDIVAIRETMSYMKHRHAAKLLPRKFYKPADMLSVISHLDMALGMRMHFLIFAASVGVPFAALSRVDKVDNFCSLFGTRPLAAVDDAQPESLARAVLDQFDHRAEMAQQVHARIGGLRTSALKTADVLTELLQGLTGKVPWPSERIS